MAKLITAFVICLLAFAGSLIYTYFHGRNLWYPWYLAVTRSYRTVEEVVRDLEPDTGKRVEQKITNLRLPFPTSKVALICLKEERRLEVWARVRSAPWVKVTEYAFTAFSGKTGPKLMNGDGQIPEGVYGIDFLHPNSSFHLSMRVTYPNLFDQSMGALDRRTDLGSDIFIHGMAVSTGCIPVGNEAIEELFYLVAKTDPKNVKVIIAPFDFRSKTDPNPDIPEIVWEQELYEQIRKELSDFIR